MGVFNQIISKLTESDGQINILNGFNIALAEKTNLFYPSSGIDINDLLYINPNRIKLACPFPQVYIHCDKLATHDYGVNFDSQLSFAFEILGVFKKTDLVEKSCNIYKLKNRSTDELKWLIFFRGYRNEEILEILVRKKVKIEVLYSVCDGVTNGMGIGHSLTIPTILYPIFKDELQLKNIITEQSKSLVNRRLKEFDIPTLRQWLKNINLIGDSNTVDQYLRMDDEVLRFKLAIDFGSIAEEFINTNGKLIIYAGHYAESEDLVIKTL
jgi:hypothetical protein